MRLLRFKRQLIRDADYWRARAWRAEHWNEPDETGKFPGHPDWLAWMTYPIELPADSAVAKATLSGPPWTIRLVLKKLDPFLVNIITEVK